jgi:uroporphyrinogen III methyltransferase/synthase
MRKGVVCLVGAGPGAAGLITLDGVRWLRRADSVVYDYLANPRLLEHARPEAERVLVGKHGGGDKVDQRRINEILVDRARRGWTVVRLKGGDPFVFGRGGEEAEALLAARIPFEVVPGVTSVTAVPAYAGIPLTHRDLASSFTVLTGYEYPDKSASAVRWDAVARRGGTLVFLMTTRQLRANMDRLTREGMPPDTPAALIRWGTRAEQSTLVGTVATLADLADAQGVQPPALVVVGDVVRLRESLAWWERKPLFGRRIVVTRPRAQAAGFIERLEDAGAEVLPAPAIEIVPPDSWDPTDDAISRIGDYDWLVFTSVNGVDAFFDRLAHQGRDVRVLHRCRLAAVGSETAKALARRGLLVDVVPEEFRAEGVAEALRAQGVRGQRVLLPRAAGAREVLPEMLRDAGATVDEVLTYRAAPARSDLGELPELLREGRVDMVTFTSSSTVRHFLASLGPGAVQLLEHTRIGCIGPITSDTARAAGLPVAVQPDRYTVEDFAAAIVAHFGGGVV